MLTPPAGVTGVEPLPAIAEDHNEADTTWLVSQLMMQIAKREDGPDEPRIVMRGGKGAARPTKRRGGQRTVPAKAPTMPTRPVAPAALNRVQAGGARRTRQRRHSQTIEQGHETAAPAPRSNADAIPQMRARAPRTAAGAARLPRMHRAQVGR